MDKLMLTPEEVAGALGVGRSTVYELMRRRDLPSLRIGRSRRVRVVDLQAYVDGIADDD